MDTAVEKCVPSKVVNSSQQRRASAPWMSEKARDKVRAKARLFRKFKSSLKEADRLAYKRANNKARRATRNARYQYEKQIAKNARSNPKAFFQLVRSRLKSKSVIPNLVTTDGEASDDESKATALNKFFCSVFTTEDVSTMPEVPESTIPSIEDVVITQSAVHAKLEKLDTNKAKGPDGNHPRVLKEAAAEIAEPVATIYKRSIEASTVPKIWKEANVTPIFKKGKRTAAENYRPVSLTSILIKMLESIICDHIRSHLKKYDLVSQHQHGFTKGRSCITQLLQVFEDWTDEIEEGNNIVCIYCDFMKAFDSVAHERLLKKLEQFGIRGGITSWIRSYLTDRRQRVSINGSSSEWAEVTSGVPQGSVLGPLLFVLFINDLPEVSDSIVKLFADDAKLYSTASTLAECEKIQRNIDNLYEWSQKWLLKFHPDKCKVMKIGKNHQEFTYKMGDVPLGETSEEKDLGIVTDSGITFRQHIAMKISKANQVVGMIRRSFHHLDTKMFSNLFKSRVRPVIEYGSSIWQPHLKCEIINIENVQRRATKLVGSIRNLSYAQRLKILQLPSLEYRRRRGRMIEVYKILHHHYDTKFPWLELDPSNRTRGHRLKLLKHRTKTTVKAQTFSRAIVNDWNSLPESSVMAPTINAFKSRLDKFWRNKIYSFTEYGVAGS